MRVYLCGYVYLYVYTWVTCIHTKMCCFHCFLGQAQNYLVAGLQCMMAGHHFVCVCARVLVSVSVLVRVDVSVVV